MEMITVYGTLYGDTISCKDKVYPLVGDSKAWRPFVGWFHISKVKNRWYLHRMLLKSIAELYPEWVDE